MFGDGWISLHVLPVTDVCRSVTCKLCSPGIFFDFLLSPTQMIDGFAFRLSHDFLHRTLIVITKIY